MDLRSVNLNLLAAFDALMAERSVTRAARRMGVTQSAMSSSLAQLRRLMDDPLFRRAPHGIEPTPRAVELAGPVREGLRHFARALGKRTFDPAADARTFVVAASDYVELVLLPPLLERVAREAPGVRIEVRPWGLQEVPRSLALGEVDLVLGYYDEVPARHRDELLFDEVYTCIVRRDHPTVRKELSLAKWLALPHVLVSQRGESPGSVDRALAARGLARTIGARVSHFLLVPVLVARTDLVAAIGARVAATFANPLRLRAFAPPVALPSARTGQVWHEQMHDDPAHRWLRRVIAEESAALPPAREVARTLLSASRGAPRRRGGRGAAPS